MALSENALRVSLKNVGVHKITRKLRDTLHYVNGEQIAIRGRTHISSQITQNGKSKSPLSSFSQMIRDGKKLQYTTHTGWFKKAGLKIC